MGQNSMREGKILTPNRKQVLKKELKDSPAPEEVGKRVPCVEEHYGSIFQTPVGNSSHCQAQLDEVHGEFGQCREGLDGFLTSEVTSPQNKVDLLVKQLTGCASTAALCQDRFARIYPYCRIPGRKSD